MKTFRVLDPNIPDRGARGLCALAVMTKAPQAGRVKTRLVPPLTPQEAAELNKCFLLDTAAAISVCCSGGLRPPNVAGAGETPAAPRGPLPRWARPRYTPRRGGAG